MMSPRITFSPSSPILNGKTPLFPEANPKSATFGSPSPSLLLSYKFWDYVVLACISIIKVWVSIDDVRDVLCFGILRQINRDDNNIKFKFSVRKIEMVW
jgi:hypothetical protein